MRTHKKQRARVCDNLKTLELSSKQCVEGRRIKHSQYTGEKFFKNQKKTKTNVR